MTENNVNLPASLFCQPAAELYLDLLKKCLTRAIFDDSLVEYRPNLSVNRPFLTPVYKTLKSVLSSRQLVIARSEGSYREQRLKGDAWPLSAETMIGVKRLENVQKVVTDVIKRGIPGDLIETGVWRGGAVILMRAVLKAYGVTDRIVYAADSFQGLPPPDSKYAADATSMLHEVDFLRVSVDQVKNNFAKYGLLDEQVKFLVGWFKDTLPSAPIDKLAVMRLDGDMYESTMDALNALYGRLSLGGYCIIDDYNAIEACKRAVTEFRARHGIEDQIEIIDETGCYWQKQQEIDIQKFA